MADWRSPRLAGARPGPVVAGRPRGGHLEAVADRGGAPRAPRRQHVCGRSPVAAQCGGASRALATTAARRQSSSKASRCAPVRRACRRRAGRRSRRHRSGCPRSSALSLGSRASASAASHCRAANVSLPVRMIASVPSAPRTAKVVPSAAISTSGCGVRAAQTHGEREQRHASQPQRRSSADRARPARRCRAAAARCRTP